MSLINMVSNFQTKFGQSYTGGPRDIPMSVAQFRIALMREELQELIDAMNRGELDEQLDACVDLVYVVLGTACQMGFRDVFDEAFARVHYANMKKELVESRHESKRDSKWDIVKPEGWQKPDLTDLVKGENDG